MFGIESGKEYFGEEFIKQFETILQKENKFLFIHGTATKENAENICNNGLFTDYPELMYTSDLVKPNDRLLYDKLKSWPHWNRKYLVMCLVPIQSGKGGMPIWNENEYEQFVLAPEFIRGYIDVAQKKIVDNDLYCEKSKGIYKIEDQSYTPISGKLVGISLPPDEQAFYDEANLFNPIDTPDPWDGDNK